MKFGAQLLTEQNPGWKAYYLSYNRLKGWIKELQSHGSADARRQFFDELDVNIRRVRQFYDEQEATIVQEVEDALSIRPVPESEERRAAHIAAFDSAIAKLREYADLNKVGFRKIAKKYDKHAASRQSSFNQDPESPRSKARGAVQEHTLQVMKEHNFWTAKERLELVSKRVTKWRKDGDTDGTQLLTSETSVVSTSFGGAGGFQPLGMRQPSEEIGAGFDQFLDEGDEGSSCARCAAAWEAVTPHLNEVIGLVVISIITVVLSVLDLTPILDGYSYLVIWVVLLVLFTLSMQWKPEGVMLGATLFLTVTGAITTEEAWAGFSNDVVLSVAGLGVVGKAVSATGVIEIVFEKVVGQPRTVRYAMIRLMLPALVMNVGISNTCVMSCILPVIDRWTEQVKLDKALFLMPLSYVLLISGVFAIFSTSTNLVAQGQLKANNLPKFDNFDLAIPTVACTTVCMMWVVLTTPCFLSRFLGPADDAAAEEGMRVREEYSMFHIKVQVTGRARDGQSVGRSGLTAAGMQPGKTSDLVTVERYGNVVANRMDEPITTDFPLCLDDVLTVRTSAAGMVGIRALPGFSILASDQTEVNEGQGGQGRELVEVVLDVYSPLVGKMLREADTWGAYGGSIVAWRSRRREKDHSARSQPGSTMASPVAQLPASNPAAVSQWGELAELQASAAPELPASVAAAGLPAAAGGGVQVRSTTMAALASESTPLLRRKQSIAFPALRAATKTTPQLGPREGVPSLPPAEKPRKLQQGDHLVFNVPMSFYKRWNESADFVLVRRLKPKADHDPTKAMMAGGILLVMIGLVASTVLPLLESVLCAIFALVVCGCTTRETVLKGVALSTTCTIVGAFGVGRAIGRHHVSHVLAEMLLMALSPVGNVGYQIAIFCSTVLLGIIFHGTATVVLMFPICMEVAERTDLPIHQLTAILCIASACQMLSPVSYQTNLMAYTAADYQFSDFPKVGAGAVLGMMIAGIATCSWRFPAGTYHTVLPFHDQDPSSVADRAMVM